MKIKPFQLERYFARHEFQVQYLLSASDCESLSLKELLNLADAEGLKLWEELALGYTESQGHPLLREEISQLYQTITPADVLVAAPEEAIFLAMNQQFPLSGNCPLCRASYVQRKAFIRILDQVLWNPGPSSSAFLSQIPVARSKTIHSVVFLAAKRWKQAGGTRAAMWIAPGTTSPKWADLI